MPKVTIRTPEPGLEVVNSDLEIEARSKDGTLIGKLKISRGSVQWKPANFVYGYDLKWSTFDKLMRNKAKQKK